MRWPTTLRFARVQMERYDLDFIREGWSDRQIDKNWLSDWILNHRSTELFKWVPDVLRLPHNFPPPRQVVFLITGHGRIPFYLHRISLLPSMTCFCGAECTSIDHFMNSCAGTTLYRNQLENECNCSTSPRYYPAFLRNRRAVEILRAMVRPINDSMPSTDDL